MATSGTARERQNREILGRLFSLQREGESDAAFARRLGVQPQHLSNYRNGHHGLSLGTALRIARAIDISMDWLLTGAGAPYRSTAVDGPADGPGDASRLLEDAAGALLDTIRVLVEEGRVERDDVKRLEGAVRTYLDA